MGSKCTQSLLLYFQPFISALYTNIKVIIFYIIQIFFRYSSPNLIFLRYSLIFLLPQLLTGPSPSLGGQGSDNVPLLLTPDNDQPRLRTKAKDLAKTKDLAKVLTKLRAAAVPSLLRRHFHIQSIT